jgi:hypothetical protein
MHTRILVGTLDGRGKRALENNTKINIEGNRPRV